MNVLLLDAARFPAKYADLLYPYHPVGPGTLPMQHPGMVLAFVELSRQACAAIVINSAAELWSELAHVLFALEPSHPLTEDVKQFLRETRLPNLQYFEHYYKLCGKPFRGTKTHEDLRLIYDLRDAIMHDKPDEANVDIEEETEKWIARLRSKVPEADLAWLPEIPTMMASGLPVPGGDKIPVMNFMRYPLADWVYKTTKLIVNEMTAMMFAFPGEKRLMDTAMLSAVPPLDALGLVNRIRIAGISLQIVLPDSKPN